MAAEKDIMVNNPAAPTPDATVKAPGTLKRFLSEVWVELRKTNWPTGNELVKFVVVVMVTIIVVAVYLSIVDLVMQHGSSYLFQIHTPGS
jgi:preprotein translocase subunit SecE